jgi:hypothetical protein
MVLGSSRELRAKRYGISQIPWFIKSYQIWGMTYETDI